MEKIRVALVDDHPVVLDGIRILLQSAEDIEIIGEAVTGCEALQLVELSKPDLILLDIELPDISGIEVAQRLHASGCPSRILALSAHIDEEYLRDLLQVGIAGYLTKDEEPAVILEAIRGAAKGEKGWFSRQIVALMGAWALAEAERQKPQLTRRELQVLHLVVEGNTNQSIGQRLKISEKTVEKHLESIFAKLEVASRVEAAVFAIREGLVS